MAKTKYGDYKERGQKWLSRIRASEKREEAWYKDAEAAEAAYSADSKSRDVLYDFNILHSNVETIVPAIYNSTPVPDVRDRFSAGDKVAKAVADVFERVISAQIDDNKLDTEIEAGAQDAFLGGRDIVRIRFDADIEDVPQQFQDPETGEMYEESQEQATNESISFEAISWRDYREGPARRFEDVPWIAFQHMIPAEELEDLQDDDMVAAQVDDEPATASSEDEDVKVWEVWCKKSQTVYFVRETDGRILKEEEDPMGLRGFFPIPKPVQPIQITGKRTPVCPFVIYKKLADELDTTTRRINAITRGLKVKGWIVGNVEDVSQLAEAGDNELVPISGFEGLAATGGIDKAIAWWPVDRAIQVLKELYVNREQTKQSIYEITGISDIVRGASKASETATAQQLKTQWGSLRIKKMQRLIERQVRDLFIMSTELISSQFSTQTLEKISGLEITEEMEQLLRDPMQRYRIDVESDSTVKADLTRVKGEMGELLQGTASYFATMAPVIEQAPEAAEPVADIYAAFARNFNIGQQGEAALEKLVEVAKSAASQPRPNPEAEAAQATARLEQAKMQIEQAKMQMDGQKMTADQQAAMAELELKAAELELKREELSLKRDEATHRARVDVAKVDLERTKATDASNATKDGLSIQRGEMAPNTDVMQSLKDGQDAIQDTLTKHAEETDEKLTRAVGQLTDIVQAPKKTRIVYKNGKAVGVESNGVTQMITRGKDGAIEGLN